jgi:hypothetical protein
LYKNIFIRELKQLKQSALPQWLVMGDFNLICNDSDKSFGNLDRTMMHRFRKALNHMEVKEIHLAGRKFT